MKVQRSRLCTPLCFLYGLLWSLFVIHVWHFINKPNVVWPTPLGASLSIPFFIFGDRMELPWYSSVSGRVWPPYLSLLDHHFYPGLNQASGDCKDPSNTDPDHLGSQACMTHCCVTDVSTPFGQSTQSVLVSKILRATAGNLFSSRSKWVEFSFIVFSSHGLLSHCCL